MDAYVVTLLSKRALVFAELLIWMVLSNATHSVAMSKTTATPQKEFLTIPLIPHHVQKSRRLSSEEERDDGFIDESGDQYYDNVNNRHSRRLGKESVGAALYHGYGTHYVDLWVGTPPQRQTVIVDTGSSWTAFPCGGCHDCGGDEGYHTDLNFDDSHSATFETIGCDDCSFGAICHNSRDDVCTVHRCYGEGSCWYADEVVDNCYVGGFHNEAALSSLKDFPPARHDDQGEEEGPIIGPENADHFGFPLKFGCQTSSTGLFKTQLADGIMGMSNSTNAFWSQMYDNSAIDTKQFSLCFSRPPGTSRDGTEAGALTLGGSDVRLHDSDMVWAVGGPPSKKKETMFGVKLRAIYLQDEKGRESINEQNVQSTKTLNLDVDTSKINSAGVIVDSGTTVSYFNKEISDSFRTAFKELSGNEYDLHTAFTESEIEKFPTIVLQLEGDVEMNKAFENPLDVQGLAAKLDPEHPYDILVAVPPAHYLEFDPKDGSYWATFHDDEKEEKVSILGANAMMGHDIFFDPDHNRMGWAESHCDYTKLLSDSGYSPDVLFGSDRADSLPSRNEASVKDTKTTSGLKNNCRSSGLDCPSAGIAVTWTLIGSLMSVAVAFYAFYRRSNRFRNDRNNGNYETLSNDLEVEMTGGDEFRDSETPELFQDEIVEKEKDG